MLFRSDTLNFNTAISQMMIFLNDVSKLEQVPRNLWEPFVIMLSPYAPHLGEELWERLNKSAGVLARAGQGKDGKKSELKGESVSRVSWPLYDEHLTLDDEKEIVVQVNGKIRDKFVLPAGSAEESMREKALASPRVQEWIAGKSVAKVIVVKDKLVNIVVKR